MKCEIYYNGEKVSMNWVSENFGFSYAKELKAEISNCKPYDSIHDNNGLLDVFVW